MRRNLWFACVLLGCAAPAAHAGYTHHFTWTQKPDPAALRACVADMKRVLDARRHLVAGIDGRGAPTVTGSAIQFNGKGEEDSHEPFIFPGQELPGAPAALAGFHFCKTNGKPYDEVVTACLLVARDHFPTSVLKIDSDGEWDDWQAGVKLYTEVFGRNPKNPFTGAATSGSSSSGAGSGAGGSAHHLPLVILIVTGLGAGAMLWLRQYTSGRSLTIRRNAKGVAIAGAVTPQQQQRIAEYLTDKFPGTQYFAARAAWRPGRPGLLVTAKGQLSEQERRQLQIFLIMELGL
jgi:hypothetical protein